MSEWLSCSGNFQSPGEPDMFTSCSEMPLAGTLLSSCLGAEPLLDSGPSRPRRKEEKERGDTGRTALSGSGADPPSSGT